MLPQDKVQGVLLGLACGDALGRPVTSWTADEIAAEYGTLRDIPAEGITDRQGGTSTATTTLACALARSLVACGAFEPSDVAARFVKVSDRTPLDCDARTRQSIAALRAGGTWDTASQHVEPTDADEYSKTACLARSTPLAIPYCTYWEKLATASMRSTQLTHTDSEALYGTAILNLTISGYLTDVAHPLQAALDWFEWGLAGDLISALEPIAAGNSPTATQPAEPVVHTLQTALEAAHSASNPEPAIVTAVNSGGMAHIRGAMTGAVVGARFGADAFPDRWLDEIPETDELIQLADELRALRE